MTLLRAWFDARSLREKRLILAMLGLAALTLAWAAIILPVSDGLNASRERHDDAVVRLADTEARVEALAALRRARPPATAGGLDAAIRASADAAGLPLETLNQLGPARVQVGLGSARAGALMAWTASLERQGLLVDSAQLTNNGDQTVAARLTLRARQP